MKGHKQLMKQHQLLNTSINPEASCSIQAVNMKKYDAVKSHNRLTPSYDVTLMQRHDGILCKQISTNYCILCKQMWTR